MADLDLLVAEPHQQHERHVLLRRRDETSVDHRLVGAAPVAARHLLVVATPGAHAVPSLVASLPTLLAPFLADVDSVWLAVGSLAATADRCRWLADELGIEVVAPDGGVVATPGAALYAGRGAGGTGWYRAAPRQPLAFHGARFPLPDWESWLPDEPLQVSGVVVRPAPCGLVISAAPFAVPVSDRFPKLVIGAPAPTPAVAADLLAGFADRPVMVVPAIPEVAHHVWQTELALRLARAVVFSTGTQVRTRSGGLSTVVPDGCGGRLYRPFPLVLRQNPGGGDQQVLDVAAPPPGWQRAGRRSYRRGDVLADVVPSGLVLRAEHGEPADPDADGAPFDPTGWTLTIGTPARTVGLPVLAAAESLLAGLSPSQRATVRVRLAGRGVDAAAMTALEQRSDSPEQSTVDKAADPPPPKEPVRPATVLRMTSTVPVSTVSTGASPGCGKPAVPDVTAEPPQPEVAAPPRPAHPPDGPPLLVPARGSTSAEQGRFTAAAGERFTEALATVNAALATWPSMRVDDSPGVKADFVAVCLFLGRGDGDAHAVNGALRVGGGGVLDGQLPCLMSGIHRLPTHRRAVLRQGRASESLEHRSTPGTVFTEPGFLPASIDLDVTVPGADIDVLIWPSTARRTSELVLGGPLDEAVFLAGARFKALAVRTAQDDDHGDHGDEGDPDVPTAPRVAVLYRELAPGETPATTDLDERDLAVLAKLDGVLASRQRGALRVVDDPDLGARLTTSMLLWQHEPASAVAS